MGRIRKTVDFGNERHVTNVNAPMFGNHNSRGVSLRDTSEAVKKVNEEHSIDSCLGKLKMNFRPHDWHIALTYSDENYSGVDEKRALKDRRNFISKLRRRCRKAGIDLKYLVMSEQGVKSNKWHHHFVLPQEISIAMLYECWQFGQVRILNTMYSNGEFRGLAKYFVDKTKDGQKENDRRKGCSRYRFSKNCAEPKITYETGLSDTWLAVPRPPKGWVLKPDSLFNSVDGWGSYPYQKYILIKTGGEKTKCRRKE